MLAYTNTYWPIIQNLYMAARSVTVSIMLKNAPLYKRKLAPHAALANNLIAIPFIIGRNQIKFLSNFCIALEVEIQSSTAKSDEVLPIMIDAKLFPIILPSLFDNDSTHELTVPDDPNISLLIIPVIKSPNHGFCPPYCFRAL